MAGMVVRHGGAYCLLLLADAPFLRQCTIDTFLAPGPGGQKKNRTYSAVRITHAETGLSACAAESRSQHENKKRALRRLKKKLALTLRSPGPPPALRIDAAGIAPARMGGRDVGYLIACATLLDALYVAEGRIRAAAKLLGISTGRVNKLLTKDGDLLSAANSLRRYFKHKPLKNS